MAKEKAKKEKIDQTEAKNNKSSKTKKNSKYTMQQKVFYTLVTILGLCTAFVGYKALTYFVLEPMQYSGAPVYGYRTEGLPEISETTLVDVEKMGMSEAGVESVDVKVSGPVIYINVRVDQSTELKAAKASAVAIADELKSAVTLEEEQNLYDIFNVQLAVYNQDPQALKETNREAELAYVNEFDTAIVEEILVHAEEYPTAATIQRAKDNIVLLSEGEIKDEFTKRVEAIKEWTAEEQEEAGNIPEKVVSQDVPQSDLATYPVWGTYNLAKDKYIWQ